MSRGRKLSFISVILAGEVIFMLPFLVPRLFRPLLLSGWDLHNTHLGYAFAAYGILATLSYLLGGPLADLFHPRILISASLVLTALGGAYLTQIPSAAGLVIVYGFFGVSTIFLMWGALIKTTHILGGEDQRSFAMGLLDAGRGLAASIVASLLIFAVSFTVPDMESPERQADALHIIYLLTSTVTLLFAVATWIFLKDIPFEAHATGRWDLKDVFVCLRSPTVWLLGIVILGAYCGYKCIDNYATYLVEVHKLSALDASKYTAIVFWLRPFGALVAGYFADRWHTRIKSIRFQLLSMCLLAAGVLQLKIALVGNAPFGLALATILSAAFFAYALRALYFSIFGDLNIPQHLVGTVTGIVSFVGFMPDIFFGWVTGYLIDAYPGAAGFEYAFLFSAACVLVGSVASLILYRAIRDSGQRD